METAGHGRTSEARIARGLLNGRATVVDERSVVVSVARDSIRRCGEIDERNKRRVYAKCNC